MLAGQNLGPFAVEKELGSGNMGAVYKARYIKTGQEVAIKIIAAGQNTNSTALARFEREATILKKLSHPNIVRLYTTGRMRETPFYVMEYIEGETLEAILQRRGRMGWEEVITIGKQLCAGLQHAHEQGVVHRDLKPANIMLTRDGTPKITDFGIAKTTEVTQLTATNCAVGTAAYMSPEQCRGEKTLTHKSDLYSLGVVFYELLTGKRPFLAETTLDMFLAHTSGKFERPSRLVLEIPIWLDTLVCQLMEKKPDQRPFDATMVGQALDRVSEKVNAQRSAGVEAVSSPLIHLPKGRSRVTDEKDMEAARILHTATTKKSLKRRTKPFYERAWFVAGAVVLVLAGLAAIIRQATRPPAADMLFLRAQAMMKSSDLDTLVKAREGPIQDYLRYYAGLKDDQSTQMHAWSDQVDVALREHQLHNRLRLNLSPEGEAEPIAHAAVRHEETGDIGVAQERWQALLKYKDSEDPNQHTWGLLAEKRVQELKEAEARGNRLRGQLEESRSSGKELPTIDGTESQGLIATRYEMFGDLAASLDTWKKLKDTSKGDNNNMRPWFLLASKKVQELGGKAPGGADAKEARLKLVQKKLAEAEGLKIDKPQEARALCDDIILLYKDQADLDLSKMVATARRLLSEVRAAAN